MASCDWNDIPCHFDSALQVLKDRLIAIVEFWFGLFINLLSYIPVPDWMQNIGSFTLPPGVVWFAQALELPAGAAIIGSSLLLRFIIRRIPFIG